MKLKHYFLVPVWAGVMAVSCSDDAGIAPENRADETFQQMYPDAAAVEWERDGTYYKADFRVGNREKEAWFDEMGEWQLTETDLSYADLPDAVKQAHESGDYKDWRVDDIDFVERKGYEPVYILEVERSSLEYDLYYLADGILAKAVPDRDDDQGYLPPSIPAKVTAFLNERYPNHKIVDTDIDDGRIEIDLIDGDFKREAEFSLDGDWIYTETDVRLNDVPRAILDVLGNSAYRSYRIDDIDFVETPAGSYYLFELESGNAEVEVKIDENGNLGVVE